MKASPRFLFVILISLALSSQSHAATMVGPGKVVSCEYVMKVDNKIVETSEQSGLLKFEVGKKQILPSVEQRLMQLERGEKIEFSLAPKDAYGPVNDKAFLDVPTSKLPVDNVETGMTFNSQDSGGRPIKGRVISVSDNIARLDFNHPLAGKTLDFQIKVIAIE